MSDYIRDELEQRGDEPQREPHAGDPVYVHGDRRTVLAVTDTAVMVDDEAGFRLQVQRDRMWWDGAAFRTWQGESERDPHCGICGLVVGSYGVCCGDPPRRGEVTA